MDVRNENERTNTPERISVAGVCCKKNNYININFLLKGTTPLNTIKYFRKRTTFHDEHGGDAQSGVAVPRDDCHESHLPVTGFAPSNTL